MLTADTETIVEDRLRGKHLGLTFIPAASGAKKILRLLIFNSAQGKIEVVSKPFEFTVGTPIIMLNTQVTVPTYLSSQGLIEGQHFQSVASYPLLDTPLNISLGLYITTIPNTQESSLVDLKKLYDAYLAYLVDANLYFP